MILSQGLPNCSAGSLGPFFAPLPSYVMQNLCSCWQWPFSLVTTGVSDSSPCMFILSLPPLSLVFQGVAYFLQPKQLCLLSVSELCFPSCPFCDGFLTALANISFLCTLFFPLSFLCSCPSCRISQPGGMCWRSRLYTIKLLVVFHNNEVSLKPFSADVAVFPQNSNF